MFVRKAIAILMIIAGVSSASAQNSLRVRYVGMIEFGNQAFVHSVAVLDTLLYLADYNSGFRVVNIIAPATPRLLELDPPADHPIKIVTSGSYVYVPDYLGLWIGDVTDRANPVRAGYYNSPGHAVDVFVLEDFAYVADNDYGLRIVDVTTPAAPQEVGVLDSAHELEAVAVWGSYAYLAENAGLRVVDVSEPGNPVSEGFIELPEKAWDVAVDGNFAYVAVGLSGVRIVDVSNPESPTEVAIYDTPGRAYGITLVDTLAFVADYDKGFLILSVTDPTHPHLRGFCDTPGKAYEVTLVNGYAFVADYSNLGVYDCIEAVGVTKDDPDPLPATFSLSPAFPNPFNSRTTFNFTLPRPGMVKFGLFDPMGRQVRRLQSSGWYFAGSHRVVVDGEGLAAGGYVVQMQAGGNVIRQGVVLLK